MVGLKSGAIALWVFVLVSIFLGCAPLQQAPLVYVSKVAVGVDVSTTTTEQPGISVVMGYKQIDAAYVPVMVSKDCDNNTDCTNQIYKIKDVYALNNVGDTGIPENALEAAERRVKAFKDILQKREEVEDEFIKARKEQEDRKNEFIGAKVKKEQADSKYDSFMKDHTMADIDTIKNKDPIAQTPEEKKLLADFASILFDRADAEKACKEIGGQISKADGNVRAANEKKEQAKENYKKMDISGLLTDLNLVSAKNTKKDAYSVFGSFDTNTKTAVDIMSENGPKADVGLIIGKVFSTGVASQNLTEGLRDHYRKNQSCLVVAKTLVSEYKKTLDVTNNAADKTELDSFTKSVIKACAAELKRN